MIIGVDNGYTYTKTSTGIIFPSIVSRDESMDINEGRLEVEINGTRYLVGDSARLGEYTFAVDLNKVDHENTMVCILTALAMSTQRNLEDYQIITGLPVSQYGKQKEELRQRILQQGLVGMQLNGQKKYIRITQADVFPQSAAIFYAVKTSGESVLVIDIGGLTVDVSQFEAISGKYKLTRYQTYAQGTLKLYSQIIKRINTEYDLDLKALDAEGVIRNGLHIYGHRQKLGFIGELIGSYVSDLMCSLKLNFNLKTAGQVPLGGGGAILLESYIKDHIPHAYLVPDAQFANAKMFAEIGKVRFAA
ncbi:MAG: ParM/StbA family protein [Firmicutes bacterium]|nr:ParM/StbA family protein [Bacillota bacterium]